MGLLVAFISCFAWFDFIGEWVELQFFPAMTLHALDSIVASNRIFAYEVSSLPIRTWLGVVFKNIRFSSEVLPVMCINAERLVVLGQIERAPHGLVVKDEKVDIENIVVDKFCFYLILCVSKRAEFTVLAFIKLIRVLRTEFLFVLIFPIKLLDSAVGFLTLISFRAMLVLGKK